MLISAVIVTRTELLIQCRESKFEIFASTKEHYYFFGKYAAFLLLFYLTSIKLHTANVPVLLSDCPSSIGPAPRGVVGWEHVGMVFSQIFHVFVCSSMKVNTSFFILLIKIDLCYQY